MRKVIKLLVSLLVFFTTPLFSEIEEKGVELYKIGVVLPLSGPIAKVGQAARNSIMLADKKFDSENKVQFIFEDDGYIIKNTISAVKKLISSHGVSGLFIFGSGPSSAVSMIAEKNKLSMVSYATLDVTKGLDYVVRHCLDQSEEVAAALKQIEKRDYSTVAIVTTENDATIAVHDDFIERTKLKIIFDQKFNPEDVDFKATATQIKALNPSAVYLLLVPPQMGIFSKQLRALGYEGDFFSADMVEVEEEIHKANNSLIGTWYSATDDSGEEAQSFFKEYKNTYNEKAIAGAVNSFDIAKLLIEGSRSEDLNHYLHNVKDFSGALGTYSADGKSGFNIKATIKKVDKSGIVYLE